MQINYDEVRKQFERLWSFLPMAYDLEIKDLYLNVFENGYACGLNAQTPHKTQPKAEEPLQNIEA